MQIKHAIAGVVILAASQIHASALEKSERVEQTIIDEAYESQKVVSSSADNAAGLQSEIDALQADIEGLEVYRQHLDKLLHSQGEEMISLDSQFDEIARTRQSIVPLMYKMLEALEVYVHEDMPVRKEIRTARLASLREIMGQADISDAEKYRRILEAYQIELDYTNKLGTHVGPIKVGGITREAEQLNLGQLSLIARSPDRKNYWVWNEGSKVWERLDVSFASQLDNAFLVASKLAPPSLLQLPLSVTEVVR